MANLLNNEDATGEAISINGGAYTFSAVGTFGGATVQLELLGPDDSTWLPIDDADFTAAGAKLVLLGQNSTVRAAVTGGTPSALYADLRRAS